MDLPNRVLWILGSICIVGAIVVQYPTLGTVYGIGAVGILAVAYAAVDAVCRAIRKNVDNE